MNARNVRWLSFRRFVIVVVILLVLAWLLGGFSGAHDDFADCVGIEVPEGCDDILSETRFPTGIGFSEMHGAFRMRCGEASIHQLARSLQLERCTYGSCFRPLTLLPDRRSPKLLIPPCRRGWATEAFSMEGPVGQRTQQPAYYGHCGRSSIFAVYCSPYLFVDVSIREGSSYAENCKARGGHPTVSNPGAVGHPTGASDRE